MKYLSLFFLLTLVSCHPKDIENLLNTGASKTLTNQDISNGLKEALDLGVKQGVNTLSATNGYYESVYKILLPAEASRVVEKLKIIPVFSGFEQQVIIKINLAAEDAVKSAPPIFAKAIREMTFTDVTNVLMGEKNAATTYLHQKTYTGLYTEFNPVIVNALNKFGALDLWRDAITKYNSLPFVEKINPDLDDHVTRKALEGLFSLIEKKESGIRQDSLQRSSELLKKVFARQDKT